MLIYQPGSPYAFTPQTSTYLEIWVPPYVVPSNNDPIIRVAQAYTHRPDLLSFDLYSTPKLWWTFSMLNPDLLKDPIWDLVADMEIRVLEKTAAQNFLR